MDAKLKAAVRRRARFRCEYCLFPARLRELEFQIDHVIPQKHSGSTRAMNLAFACFRCNSYKGPNLAGIDPQSARIVPLFNPREDVWTEHFRWDGPVLIGKTPEGRATIAVLRMNRADVLLLRRSLIAEGVSFAPAKQRR